MVVIRYALLTLVVGRYIIICMTGRTIFVFGSNTAGIHGAGAAKEAQLRHGAITGKGHGPHGDSYAIPTRKFVRGRLQTLPLPHIQIYVNTFLKYAEAHPELTFNVTPIGCGFAGYTPDRIGPMFMNRTPNVVLPEAFSPYVKSIS